jgi:hypothetical protein
MFLILIYISYVLFPYLCLNLKININHSFPYLSLDHIDPGLIPTYASGHKSNKYYQQYGWFPERQLSKRSNDYIDDIDKINVVERLIRREQAIRDRQNPFVNYSEDEFIDRYRLNKECVLTSYQPFHNIYPIYVININRPCLFDHLFKPALYLVQSWTQYLNRTHL